MRAGMTIKEVHREGRVGRVELMISQRPGTFFRQNFAELHLIAATVEATMPCVESWVVDVEERDALGVVAVRLTDGSTTERSRAAAVLREVVERLTDQAPRFPLPGAYERVSNPFAGVALATEVTGLMEPRLILKPLVTHPSRQLRIMLRLLAAATELTAAPSERWTVELVDRLPAAAAVQIELTAWEVDEANRAAEVLDRVSARCHGAPIGGRERLAAPTIQMVWPAIARHPWAAPIALYLWA